MLKGSEFCQVERILQQAQTSSDVCLLMSFQPSSDVAMSVSTSLLRRACLFYSDDFLVTVPQPCSQAASVPHLEGISYSKSSGYASSPGKGGGCSSCKYCVLVDEKLRGLKIWRGGVGSAHMDSTSLCIMYVRVWMLECSCSDC